MEAQLLLAMLCIFIVAVLYSSVGHGGASGYQAVLAIFGFTSLEMASISIVLNIIVAGISFSSYKTGKHFSWPLTWPFVLSSIPAAFMGALIRLPDKLYGTLLAITLLFAACRLLRFEQNESGEPVVVPPSPKIALAVGGGLGFLSGMLGVGGGIFLSPVLLCFHWGNAKQTAATSAFFILVNAIAGMLGRFLSHHLMLTHAGLFIPAVILGGLLGSACGAYHFRNLTLYRLLALVLFLAVGRLLWPSSWQYISQAFRVICLNTPNRETR